MRPIAAVFFAGLALAACQRDSNSAATNGAMQVNVGETPAPPVVNSAYPADNAATNAAATAPEPGNLDAVVDSALANSASPSPPVAAEPAAPPADPPAPKTRPAPTPAATTYRFTGTEPFWSGTLSGTSLTLRRPEHADLNATLTGPTSSGGWQAWSGRWQQSTVAVRIRRHACSDGMSDERYPYEAQVSLWGTTLSGCAR